MKKRIILIAIIFTIFAGIFLLLVNLNRGSRLYSRSVMEFTESLVKEDMTFSPPSAARNYAAVSGLYYEIISKNGDTREAVIASVGLLKTIYTEKSDEYKFDRFLTTLNIDGSQKLSDDSDAILQKYISKYGFNEDKFKKSRVVFADKNKWVGESPSSYEAVNYDNFVLKEDLAKLVPKAPIETSEEFKKSLKNSEWLTSIRTGEQGAYINFWSGMHMSPGIAGIWQDRLYEVVKNYNLTDKEYAYAQMVLANSLADTMSQIWKVKFENLSKRPSSYSDKISLSMIDPNYPGYVSEYSATAYVASSVLGQMFPKGKSIWDKDFANASQIGIWAGCAFSFDEEQSLFLGKFIYENLKKNLNLQVISNGSFLPFEIFASKVGVYERGY